jgi:NAD(P)-dependent dehydrogenase (short-subunit alcohol dehydrogenase family)
MARVFITGSTDGLGYAAAKALIDEGHEVALHARSRLAWWSAILVALSIPDASPTR